MVYCCRFPSTTVRPLMRPDQNLARVSPLAAEKNAGKDQGERRRRFVGGTRDTPLLHGGRDMSATRQIRSKIGKQRHCRARRHKSGRNSTTMNRLESPPKKKNYQYLTRFDRKTKNSSSPNLGANTDRLGNVYLGYHARNVFKPRTDHRFLFPWI